MPTTRLLLLLSLQLAIVAADPSTPLSYPSPYPKVRFVLDPIAYRSASQGPVMPVELKPATRDDYDEIDHVIDRVSRTHGWDPVILQYKKSTAWEQWEGTIFERLWKNVAKQAVVPILLLLLTRMTGTSKSWWKVSKEHKLADVFAASSTGFNYLLTLTTFVTTFFVGHSHDFWRTSYKLTRSVQGRLNDIGLLCATHAKRTPSGALDADAEALLKANARNLRVLHCLFYADVCAEMPTGAPPHTVPSSVHTRRHCAASSVHIFSLCQRACARVPHTVCGGGGGGVTCCYRCATARRCARAHRPSTRRCGSCSRTTAARAPRRGCSDCATAGC